MNTGKNTTKTCTEATFMAAIGDGVTKLIRIFGDEPTVIVRHQNPYVIDRCRMVAAAQGLRVVRSRTGQQIDVTGFDQDWPARPRLAPVEQPTQVCKGCGAEFLDDGHDYCVRCWDCLRDADWDHDDEEAQS